VQKPGQFWESLCQLPEIFGPPLLLVQNGKKKQRLAHRVEVGDGMAQYVLKP
jgi:hypothetical protein